MRIQAEEDPKIKLAELISEEHFSHDLKRMVWLVPKGCKQTSEKLQNYSCDINAVAAPYPS